MEQLDLTGGVLLLTRVHTSVYRAVMHRDTNPPKKSYFYSNTSAGVFTNRTFNRDDHELCGNKIHSCRSCAKGWISGSAETYYNDGVLNSITLWLPNWPTTINHKQVA
jgi:hypothetical protein